MTDLRDHLPELALGDVSHTRVDDVHDLRRERKQKHTNGRERCGGRAAGAGTQKREFRRNATHTATTRSLEAARVESTFAVTSHTLLPSCMQAMAPTSMREVHVRERGSCEKKDKTTSDKISKSFGNRSERPAFLLSCNAMQCCLSSESGVDFRPSRLTDCWQRDWGSALWRMMSWHATREMQAPVPWRCWLQATSDTHAQRQLAEAGACAGFSGLATRTAGLRRDIGPHCCTCSMSPL